MKAPPGRTLIAMLAAVCLLLVAIILFMRREARDKFAPPGNAARLPAAADAPMETLTLLIASDVDGSLTPETVRRPLPQDASMRSRAVLEALLAQYAQPRAAHPLAPGPAVDDVFLTPLPSQARPGTLGKSAADGRESAEDVQQLAVVNLTGSFAANHPSGIETETLTLLSIIGTLHANQPRISQVRFLVDGQPRDTLAGHADLTRVYLATDQEVHP